MGSDVAPIGPPSSSCLSLKRWFWAIGHCGGQKLVGLLQPIQVNPDPNLKSQISGHFSDFCDTPYHKRAQKEGRGNVLSHICGPVWFRANNLCEAISKPIFLDIVATNNNQIPHKQHILGNLCVFFSSFGHLVVGGQQVVYQSLGRSQYPPSQAPSGQMRWTTHKTSLKHAAHVTFLI